MVGPWKCHLTILHHYNCFSFIFFLFAVVFFFLGVAMLTQVNVSANKQTLFSKTRGRLFSSAISAPDMCTISNTLFGSAMNKTKVQLSMTIRNKIAKPFPMRSKRKR